jgi:hypothetical protein
LRRAAERRALRVIVENEMGWSKFNPARRSPSKLHHAQKGRISGDLKVPRPNDDSKGV